MSGDRELDALRLIAGTLARGDVVAELGEVAHSLAEHEALPAGVQLCLSEAALAEVASLAWLRLATAEVQGTAVQRAIARHRPKIVVPARLAEPTEDVLEALAAPNYCAMARVGEFLFLAPRTDCEPVAAKSASKLDALRSAMGGARELVESGLQVAGASRRRGGLRQRVKSYRPPTLFARKLMKLTTDPERFLRDAKSPLLHGVAADAVSLLLPGRPRRTRRRTTVHDLPKRSILVFAGPGTAVDLKIWLSLCESLTLTTELVVVADVSQEATLARLMSLASCPRLRVYLMAGSAPPATLLDYGMARCYASNLAIVPELPEGCAARIADAFSQVRDDQPFVFDPETPLIAARRTRLRDHVSGIDESPELGAALEQLVARIEPGIGGDAPILAGNESCFTYPTLALRDSFSSAAGPPVYCLEKRASWMLPVSPSAREQRSKVSVIMTVFNAAATVQQSIESVLEQTYQNLELLAIDDGSDDGSLEILLAIAARDPRLRVLQTANNSGTYFAKNVGLTFAQGTYVSFQDSDDISAGNRLALQVEALDCDPLAIGNYTRYQRISEDGREVWFDGKTNRPGYITLLFRRQQVLEAVGFFDSVRISADAELVSRLRLATRRPVRLLPVVSYFALQAEGSLTTAGAGAFAIASDGKMAMPPVRQAYRDAASAWHSACYEGRARAHIPFPLGRRPFEAPFSIASDAGVASLETRLLAFATQGQEAPLAKELGAMLRRYGPTRLGDKVGAVLDTLAARKRVKDCRALFLSTVAVMEAQAAPAGLVFADGTLERLGDVPSAAAIARRHADQGNLLRAIEIFEEQIPQDRRGPLYERLMSQARVLVEGVDAHRLDLATQSPRARHILYYVNQSVPFHQSGYALRTHYLLAALKSSNWSPCAVTRFGYPADRPDFVAGSDLPISADIDGLSYVFAPDSQGMRGLTASEQHPLLVQSLGRTALSQRPSLIHSASNHAVGLAGARVARELGVPSVYEMRGLWHMTRSARQPAYQDSDHYRMIERLEVQAAHESDFVLTLTAAMKELVVAGGVASEKVAVLPNAVDAEQFVAGPPSAALLRAHGMQGKVGIGFVGSMSDYEGLDLLLEAVASLRERSDFHVVLVGDGSARADLERLAQRLAIQHRVSFVGRVPHEQVRDYYALLDVLVYPRKDLRVCEYVSPLKPFEALALERAVVVSSAAALAEIVEDEHSGLVFEKGSSSALARSLARLLDDASLRAALGKAARERVLAQHTWQAVANTLQGVYERLLSSGGL